MDKKYRDQYESLKTLDDYKKVFEEIIEDYCLPSDIKDHSVELKWIEEGKKFAVHCVLDNGKYVYDWEQETDWSIDRMYNNFTYKMVKNIETVDEVQDWTVKQEFKDIICDYLHNVPNGKCLVISLNSTPNPGFGFDMGGHGKHRTYFLHFDVKWPMFSHRLYYFDRSEPGSGPDHESNLPRVHHTAELIESYESRFIDGRWIPGKITKLVNFEEYPDDPDGRLGKWYISSSGMPLNNEDNNGFYVFGDISDVKIVDMPEDMYLDEFAEEYMLKQFPEMVQDVPDDPRIDEEYASCESYNPEAFDHWKEYFCRKRCMIDRGAGCDSNLCKLRIIQFVDYQYRCYKIPSVDGQPNRFKAEETA